MSESTQIPLEEYSYFFYESDITEPSTKRSMDTAAIVFYVITCVLGIPGNTLVMWIAGMKMKRTVNTIWFLNLAIADFLCCLSIPFCIIDVMSDFHWPYGKILCRVLPTVVILNMFASVFTLTLISIDRFLQVIKPVWSQNHRTTALASLLCAISWFCSMLLCLPSMIYRDTYFDNTNNRTSCTYRLQDHDEDGSVMKAIAMSRFVFGFLIPFLIIAISYALIMRKVTSSRFSASQKPMKIILGVILAFFLCWIPYHIVGLMVDYGGETSQRVAMDLDQLSVSLAYLNSCLNPLLYVFIGQDFKEKVKMSLSRVLQNAFGDSTLHSSAYSKAESSRTTNSAETHI